MLVRALPWHPTPSRLPQLSDTHLLFSSRPCACLRVPPAVGNANIGVYTASSGQERAQADARMTRVRAAAAEARVRQGVAERR
jgi:hypothetical protein